MDKRTYAEKLKDPRWQKKRLEVMQSAGFKCESCGDTEEELHVHHAYYEKDYEPWGYPDNAYMVLCSRCHNKWHNLRAGFDKMFCKMGTDQLQEVVSILTLLNMMGPNITHLFFDIISGYHFRQLKESDNE